MATASIADQLSSLPALSESDPQRKSRRRQTSHLKVVPETRELRERMRARCAEVVAQLDKSLPLTKDQMEVVVRRLRATPLG